jgi:hypothetical protein
VSCVCVVKVTTHEFLRSNHGTCFSVLSVCYRMGLKSFFYIYIYIFISNQNLQIYELIC